MMPLMLIGPCSHWLPRISPWPKRRHLGLAVFGEAQGRRGDTPANEQGGAALDGTATELRPAYGKAWGLRVCQPHLARDVPLKSQRR